MPAALPRRDKPEKRPVSRPTLLSGARLASMQSVTVNMPVRRKMDQQPPQTQRAITTTATLGTV